MNKVIKQGPFAGTEIPVDATRAAVEGSGVWWSPRDRTPSVLDRFPPEAGWGITVTRQPSDLLMPAMCQQTNKYYTDPTGSTMRFPTVYVDAALVREDGKVVAQAGTLVILDGPRAFEQGENNARNRLYEALGLCGAHDIDEFAEDPAAKPPVIKDSPSSTANVSSINPMSGVRAVPSTNRHHQDAPVAAVLLPAKEPAPQAAVKAEAPPVQKGNLSPGLINVANQRAAMKGVPIPAFKDDAEVEQFIDQLAS